MLRAVLLGVGVSRSRPVPAVRPNKFSASTQRNNTALNTSQRRLTRQKSLSLETVEERPQRPLCSLPYLTISFPRNSCYIFVLPAEIF